MKKILTLIVLLLTISTAYADIYIGENDKPVQQIYKTDPVLPVMFTFGNLNSKDADFYLWIENVKGSMGGYLPDKFLDNSLAFKPIIMGVLNNAAIKKANWSSYYNVHVPFKTTDITGIGSFTVYVCIKEHIPVLLIKQETVFSLKSQALCNSKKIVVQ